MQELAAQEENEPDGEKEKFVSTGGGSGIGAKEIDIVRINYSHDSGFMRLRPRLTLKDLDGAWVMPILNRSLAEKVSAIHIFSNGYKLQEIAKENIVIDDSPFSPDIPARFTDDELLDRWVRIRHRRASMFVISFSDQTPKRLFVSRQTGNSLSDKTNRKWTI